MLALGGAGTVGSGIVKALLDKGKRPRGHSETQTLLLCNINEIFSIYSEVQEDFAFSVLTKSKVNID